MDFDENYDGPIEYDSDDNRPYEIDDTRFALEGMWMANPGEYPEVKFTFDESNTVRHVSV
jgi:hypothetical protein